MDDLLSLNVDLADGFTYIHAAGELDRSNADRFERRLDQLVRTAIPRILDLSELTYVDSAGLRAISLSAQRAPMRLVIPETARIRRTVAISGIGELVAIFGSVVEAEQGATPPGSSRPS